MVNGVYLVLTDTVNGGGFINEKFYSLPEEKQHRIINAGYHVFGYNSYKKSPVSEIALTAGISKSLLFHYFHNKKELYLFLWNEAMKLTSRALVDGHCYESCDLFEMMLRGMNAKFSLMKIYPDLTAFTMNAFYEKDPAVSSEIQQSYQTVAASSTTSTLKGLNPADFRSGLDIEMMIKTMYWTCEGYLWVALKSDHIDIDVWEKDFKKIIEFWKSAYCREEQKG
jgi:TetR/AcrR family transcriptional regulator